MSTLKATYSAYVAACERAIALGVGVQADDAWREADDAYAAYVAADTTRMAYLTAAKNAQEIGE